MRFGAIDVGTNSIHLIVVELDPYLGSIRNVLKAREMVRLGAGDALTRNRLGRKAMTRGAEVISEFAARARAAGAVDIRAVATSAVRDAGNRDEFIALVQAKSGLALTVLSGRDEARLIHLGVSRGYPLDERLVCIVDIGGGSTELIVADHHRTYLLTSIPIGSLRLFERFRHGDDIDMPALQAALEEALEPVCAPLRSGDALPGEARIATVIGTSGTWLGLAALDAARRGVTFNRGQGYELHLRRLEELQERMLSLSVEERKRMPGMNPRRSDIILAGNAIAVATLRALGHERAAVCDRALREGLIADYLQRNHDRVKAVGDQRLRRFDAVRELTQRLGIESIHETHVADLALDLFDSFVQPEHFTAADRDLLFSAAIAHDVGRAIDVSAFHKHGAYILRNASLAAWRPREKEMLAQIVRYQRKALPKATHPEYTALDAGERLRVERIAAFLRIATALDVRRLGRVTRASFLRNARSRYTIEVQIEGDGEPELSALRASLDLFIKVFGAAPELFVVANVEEAEVETVTAP